MPYEKNNARTLRFFTLSTLVFISNLAFSVPAKKTKVSDCAPNFSNLAGNTSLALAPDTRPIKPMSFQRTGMIRSFFNGAAVGEDLNQAEVNRLYSGQMVELASRRAVKDPNTEVQLDKYKRSEGNWINFQLTVKGAIVRSLSLRHELQKGEKSEEVIARMAVAVAQYKEHFANPNRLNQEINMFRYDLLKLLRLTEGRLKEKVKDAIVRLDSVKDESDLGKRFSALLDAKVGLIQATQELQANMDANKQAPPPKQALGKKGGKLIVANGKGKATKKGALGSTGSSRYKVGRVNGGGGKRTYYYPEEYYPTNTINTMAWMYDPYFMLSNPWYWGVRDGDPLSYLLLYDMMAHQNRDYHSPYFVDRAPYEPERFIEPIEPRFFENEAQPIVEHWERAPIGEAVMPEQTVWSENVGAGSTPHNEASGWNSEAGADIASRVTEYDMNRQGGIGSTESEDARESSGGGLIRGEDRSLSRDSDSRDSGYGNSGLSVRESERNTEVSTWEPPARETGLSNTDSDSSGFSPALRESEQSYEMTNSSRSDENG